MCGGQIPGTESYMSNDDGKIDVGSTDLRNRSGSSRDIGSTPLRRADTSPSVA